VGQGAIAIQCRADDVEKFAVAFDAPTARFVNLERAFQTALGGGCHTAFAAHATESTLHFFHEQTGSRSIPLTPADFAAPAETARRVLAELGFNLT
jgi:hydroxymethylbilane synthase